MSQDPRHRLGISAEERAVTFLKENGYHILQRNVKMRLGEIDIVAMEDDILVFVEVRSRTDPDRVHPAATITRKKQRQVVRCAQAYCALHHIRDTMLRFDVVTLSGKTGELELFKNAFEADR